MKLYSLSASNMTTQKTDTHVNNLLNSCWPSISSNRSVCQPDQFLLDDHKLMLEEHDIEMDSLQYDSDAEKGGVDVFDSLILSNQSLNTELAELKPLPPFTGYTGHLSINGISGHHYHAIAHRHISSEENNNFLTTNLNQSSSFSSRPLSAKPIVGIDDPVGIGRILEEQNIVSSSTCLPDSALYPETTSDNNTTCYQDVKLFSDSGIENKMCSSMADSCAMTIPCPDSISSVRIYADSKEQAVEFVDMSSIDDIAAIIGSAIADTTVPNQTEERDGADSRDSWMDLDAWIDGNCVPSVSQQESLNEFILPNSPVLTSSEPPTSTLHNLLTQNNYMPLLQSRLQNGPPLKNETPSSTSYGNDSITTTNSPPDSVVSTTDNLITNGSGRCMSSSLHPHQPQQQNEWFNSMQNTSKVKRRIKQQVIFCLLIKNIIAYK
ncbi:ichor-like [Contarinia nasturtii]|uniref:ichor-like n=1 Tax=Contarinia nasturtii TaxID=265458 RepID=UPI0012D3D9C1|nr:ichor-like [Contarinia nasturtii]